MDTIMLRSWARPFVAAVVAASVFSSISPTRARAGPPADHVITWFGGGGEGEPVVSTGVWDFDNLSPAQRSAPIGCGNSVGGQPGEILAAQGWQPDPQSTVPPRVEAMEQSWIDPQQWPGSAVTQSVDGGVVAFYDPQLHGFAPGQISLMNSPVVYLPPLLPSPYDPATTPMEFHFALNSNVNPALSGLRLIVGSRAFASGQWTPWSDQVQPLPTGPQFLSYTVPQGGEAIQFHVGIQCAAIVPIIDPGPFLDDGTGFYWNDSMLETLSKGIPDLSQDDGGRENVCQATAYADCLSYWDDHGYEEIVDDEHLSKKAAHDKLQQELINLVHGRAGGHGNRGEMGLVHELDNKGVYEGNDQPDGRAPLTAERKAGAEATWEYLMGEFVQCHDVILGLQWCDADGNVIDPDPNDDHVPGHTVTVNGLSRDSHGNITLALANPWDGRVDNPRDGGSDYNDAKVTVNSDGTVRLDSDYIENNAAGISGADHLCVPWIDVVKPVAGGRPLWGSGLVVDEGTRPTETPLVAGRALGTFSYAATNDMTQPIAFIVMEVDVPFENVESPPGWTWAELPTHFPGTSGCNNQIGETGIAWSTTSNPIPPGGTLSGFRFQADAVYPTDSTALVYYMEDMGPTGRYGLVWGPTPFESSGVPDQAPAASVDGLRLDVRPNPARSAIAIRVQGIRSATPVEVFDAAGRIVRRIADAAPTGSMTQGWSWNLVDDHGRRVPSGVYWVRARDRSGAATREVVVVD
jgi:hypothetical protein